MRRIPPLNDTGSGRRFDSDPRLHLILKELWRQCNKSVAGLGSFALVLTGCLEGPRVGFLGLAFFLLGVLAMQQGGRR